MEQDGRRVKQDKRRELLKSVKVVLLAEAALIASNRALAHFGGGDPRMFDLLLLMAGLAIPLAAVFRYWRRQRRG